MTLDSGIVQILDRVRIAWMGWRGQWIESADSRSHVSLYLYEHLNEWHGEAVLWVGPAQSRPGDDGWILGKLQLQYRSRDKDAAREWCEAIVSATSLGRTGETLTILDDDAGGEIWSSRG